MPMATSSILMVPTGFLKNILHSIPELNKNYAIVPDNLPFYSHPIEDDIYIIGNYHYGERITVPYVATQDTEWGYTGIGWVRLNSGTVSEIL
jgi:hypothetical protein